MTLTNHEEKLRQECFTRGGHCSVTAHESENIVLLWPSAWSPRWCDESGVKDVREVVCWLERAYQQMTAWTEFDPNRYYSCKNGVRDRLAFVCNGQRDFVFGGALRRPYIGLGKGQDPTWHASEDWFGWLCHELSHDFLHEPRFCPGLEKRGDGLCDYSRCKLLSALGMEGAAGRFLSCVMEAQPRDACKRPAKLLLQYECAHSVLSPVALTRRLRGNCLSQEVACPTW